MATRCTSTAFAVTFTCSWRSFGGNHRVEYKVNLLAPALGERMIARARVTKPGRTLTVCAGDVFAVTRGEEKIVVTMLATLMAVAAEGR